MIVYLSGGMTSGWQDEVKKRVSQVRFLDPRDHGLNAPDRYVMWDLAAVSECDIVFAYMESDNPSGIGLAAELGFAKAQGKLIIFVDSKYGKHFDFIRAMSDVIVKRLEDGIAYLSKLAMINEERR